ncbi:hypothetical protein ACFRJ9_21765 [Paenarthrobacter sp. NPDC056912]|uniref:hypothetical protein n=1 Tax=Paenarthrobacter sp. NPDC056912 TaxID=3345965 RepID=UPI00366BC217
MRIPAFNPLDPVGSSIEDFFKLIGKGLGDAITAVWDFMLHSSSPQFTNQGVLSVYSLSFAIGIAIALGLFLVQVLTAFFKGGAEEQARAVLGLLAAVFIPFILYSSVADLDKLSATLASDIMKATAAENQAGAGAATVAGGALFAAVFGTLLAMGAAGVIICGVFLLVALGAVLGVWMMLQFRSVSMYFGTVMAPWAMAGLPFKPTRRWTGRWATAMGTLLMVTPVTALVMSLGGALLANSFNTACPGALEGGKCDNPDVWQMIGVVIQACIILVIACVVPMMVWKMLHFVGGEVSAAVENHGGAAFQKAADAVKNPSGVWENLRERFGGAGDGGGPEGGDSGGTGQNGRPGNNAEVNPDDLPSVNGGPEGNDQDPTEQTPVPGSPLTSPEGGREGQGFGGAGPGATGAGHSGGPGLTGGSGEDGGLGEDGAVGGGVQGGSSGGQGELPSAGTSSSAVGTAGKAVVL